MSAALIRRPSDAAGEFDVVDRNLNGYGMGRRGAP